MRGKLYSGIACVYCRYKELLSVAAEQVTYPHKNRFICTQESLY